MSKHKISKSRYLKGLQCPKLLWLSVHEPDAEELKPDLMTQYRFATGHKVGALARQQFPTGKLVENTRDFSSWLAATTEAMNANHDVIFEAAFSNDQAFVAIDILRKSDSRWELIEVKSSLKVKDTYIDDLSIQYWMLTMAGISVQQASVMTLNGDCIHPDRSNLFRLHNVTDQVTARLPAVESNIESMHATLNLALPTVTVGVHCYSPHPCPFKARCWPGLPEHHVSTLYRLDKESAFALERDHGISEIHHLVDEIKLTRLQQRQADAVKSNSVYISKNLAAELMKIKAPVAYLDFETIMPAIPMFNGDKPYQQIPVQFSCHIENERGDLAHVEWIAKDNSDPRRAMADTLLQACENTKTIVAYNAKFEKSCIDAIARAVPEKSERLLALKDRFFDFLPLVRNHIYDPKFKGSFSIKSVLPALVPNTGYDTLEISNGMLASIRLEQIVTEALAEHEKEVVIGQLLKYCALDSMAMVLLKQALEEIARRIPPTD